MLLPDSIEIILGDITKQAVEAIVNAANESLLGGGGVDGAIHRAAGPGLLTECRQLNGCKVGAAKLTSGYQLPAKWVIHTVGPIWRGGQQQEDQLLAGCYRNVLQLAAEHQIRTIAFPAISTGAYGYPLASATRIALTETKQFLRHNDTIRKVIFVCFSEQARQVYQQECANQST
jgi:O-acetyl-ADP-ribose deacetylase